MLGHPGKGQFIVSRDFTDIHIALTDTLEDVCLLGRLGIQTRVEPICLFNVLRGNHIIIFQ